MVACSWHMFHHAAAWSAAAIKAQGMGFAQRVALHMLAPKADPPPTRAAAMKLVAEAFPWSAHSHFIYTRDNHNSAVGMREAALRAGAGAAAVNFCAASSSDTSGAGADGAATSLGEAFAAGTGSRGQWTLREMPAPAVAPAWQRACVMGSLPQSTGVALQLAEG